MVGQHDQNYNSVKGIEKCNIDVMFCVYHLSLKFKNPSAILMLLRLYCCWKLSSTGLLSLFTSELEEESCKLWL